MRSSFLSRPSICSDSNKKEYQNLFFDEASYMSLEYEDYHSIGRHEIYSRDANFISSASNVPK